MNSAARYLTPAVELLHEHPDFRPVVKPAPNGVEKAHKSPRPNPRPLTAHTAFDIYNSEHKETESIIDNLLFPGLTIFVARPKVGKSWWALQIAIAIATNTMLGGTLRVRKPGRVLYVALEESQRRTAPRLRKLTACSDFLEDIEFVYEIDPLMAGGAAQIDSYLTERPCALVVIDTFYAFSKQSERKNVDLLQADYNQINTLREVCEKHKCAMLLIHHARKAAGEGVDVVLGTSGISAACDAIWTLQRKTEGDCLLSITGREMEETVYGMRLESGEPFGWKITGRGAEANLSSERRAIVELLAEEPMVPKAIATALSKNPSTVRRLLQGLAKDGVIAKNGETYSLCSRGDQ